MATYSALLRNPRWQKKRLEILNRDDFACRHCEDTNSTLNVHHLYYIKGNDPWEYPDSALLTLCEECHSKETASLKQEKALLVETLAQKGFTASEFNQLSCAFRDAEIRTSPFFLAEALDWILRDRERQDALVRQWIEELERRQKASKAGFHGKN